MGFVLLKNNGFRAGQLGLKIFRRKAGHKPKKGESEKKKVRVSVHLFEFTTQFPIFSFRSWWTRASSIPVSNLLVSEL